MNNADIDEIINNAGYGIKKAQDKKELFLQRNLVEYAYKIGFNSGVKATKKFQGFVDGWANDKSI